MKKTQSNPGINIKPDEMPRAPNTSLRMPLALKDEVSRLAQQEQRSLSAQILYFVRQGVAGHGGAT